MFLWHHWFCHLEFTLRSVLSGLSFEKFLKCLRVLCCIWLSDLVFYHENEKNHYTISVNAFKLYHPTVWINTSFFNVLYIVWGTVDKKNNKEDEILVSGLWNDLQETFHYGVSCDKSYEADGYIVLWNPHCGGENKCLWESENTENHRRRNTWVQYCVLRRIWRILRERRRRKGVKENLKVPAIKEKSTFFL